MPSKKTGKNIKGADIKQVAKKTKKTLRRAGDVAKKINQIAAKKIAVPLSRKILNKQSGGKITKRSNMGLFGRI